MNERHAALLGCIMLSGCAHQPPPPIDSSDIPGFFSGWWHGATALFTLLASLFSDARVYAFPNSGFGYDCGFVIAVVGWCIFWIAMAKG